jgi:hypothetical protein
MYYYNNIIIILLFVVSLIVFNIYKKIDGFQNRINTIPWSSDLIKRFNIYQTSVNKNVNQFNLDQIQKQATPEEAEQYLKTGYWFWSDELKNLYIDKVWQNPIIKIDPQYALNYAMSIYNQNAARELLAWNTKEGQFLLYGGDLGISDGMPKNITNTIKCSDNSQYMEKTIYTGINVWNKTKVKPEDIPKEMPGFSFVKNPCNPCAALNSPGDFTCPFKLNYNGNDEISEPWKELWNLN